jgi:hypothetical protein
MGCVQEKLGEREEDGVGCAGARPHGRKIGRSRLGWLGENWVLAQNDLENRKSSFILAQNWAGTH